MEEYIPSCPKNTYSNDVQTAAETRFSLEKIYHLNAGYTVHLDIPELVCAIEFCHMPHDCFHDQGIGAHQLDFANMIMCS